MKVFLIGMPGAGKSTLGRELSKLLNYSFSDLDHEIEKTSGLTIPEIFRQHGEAYFRQLESELLRSISETAEDFVLATGGGTPCFHKNIEYMNTQGLTIYLKAETAVLVNRLIRKGLASRPLLMGKSEDDLHHYLAETLANRATFYAQAGIVFERRSLASDAVTLASTIRHLQL